MIGWYDPSPRPVISYPYQTMYTITRKFTFDSAHRVLHHESKCKHLHGHTYTALVTVTAAGLDKLDRVIDFSVLKTLVGGWIDNHWDHNALFHPYDPLLPRKIEEAISATTDDKDFIFNHLFGGKEPYVMATGNPTAENIAKELFHVADMLLHKLGIEVVRVRIWETPNCHAEYTRDDSRTAEPPPALLRSFP